jgi:hypothetical protein
VTSPFNKQGQLIERVRNPSAFHIKASIRPWAVHPDLKREAGGKDIKDIKRPIDLGRQP